MIMGLYQICGSELGRETRIICSLYKNKSSKAMRIIFKVKITSTINL